jgi:uncharacterized peroxidase-related enzyme
MESIHVSIPKNGIINFQVWIFFLRKEFCKMRFVRGASGAAIGPKRFRRISMSRISIPALDQTPAASRPLLDGVRKQLGIVPNLMSVLGNSPAALGGYLALSGALAKGALGAKTGERIALAIAEINACDYCLAAHAYLGRNVAKLDDAEIAANRNGGSSDPKADAAVRFAATVALERGHVSDSAVRAVKAAGYSDGEVMEIVVHVALNTLTNYANVVAQTEIDFPAVDQKRAA